MATTLITTWCSFLAGHTLAPATRKKNAILMAMTTISRPVVAAFARGSIIKTIAPDFVTRILMEMTTMCRLPVAALWRDRVTTLMAMTTMCRLPVAVSHVNPMSGGKVKILRAMPTIRCVVHTVKQIVQGLDGDDYYVCAVLCLAWTCDVQCVAPVHLLLVYFTNCALL